MATNLEEIAINTLIDVAVYKKLPRKPSKEGHRKTVKAATMNRVEKLKAAIGTNNH